MTHNQRGLTIIHMLGIVIAVLCLGLYVFADKDTIKKPRSEQVQALFFADGTNYEVIKLVKKNMNDPKSFEHVETSYADNGADVVVFMKFRGNNAFGAKVLSEAVASVAPATGEVTNLVIK